VDYNYALTLAICQIEQLAIGRFLNPAGIRRDRLIMPINRQIELVKFHQEGRKRRGSWSWVGDGTYMLPIKYRKTPL
jgi:hypothetical protein